MMMHPFKQGYDTVMKVANLIPRDKEKMKQEATDHAQNVALGTGIVGGGLASGLTSLGIRLDTGHGEHFGPLAEFVEEARKHVQTPANMKMRYGNYAAATPALAGRLGVDPSIFVPRSVAKANQTLATATKYSPAAVLHELGHMGGSERKSIKALQQAGKGGQALSSLAGSGLAYPLAFSENETLQNLAPVAAIAPSIPLLAEEARASAGARKMMKNMINDGLADKKHMRSLYRTLGPAYATYAAAAAVPAVAAWAGKEHIQKERNMTDWDIIKRKFDQLTGR